MEFWKAKRRIQKYTALVGEKSIKLIQENSKETDFGAFRQEIWKRLDDSRSLNEFLMWVGRFFEELESKSKEVIYSQEQASELRDIIIIFSEMTVCLLANMYGKEKYEELSKLGQFVTITQLPAFSVGLYLINENNSRQKEETQDSHHEIDQRDVENEKALICGMTNQIVAEGSIFRYRVYMNFKESCWWCVNCGLIARDSCLAILLKYFCPEDEDIEFKLLVNKLISPEDKVNEDIEASVDRVIAQSFGALPDGLKRDIIEQCSYRDPFRELPDTELPGVQIDPCPKKVLNPVIRRHVNKMIQTMWQKQEENQAELRELMKYNCIDCAYVSARLKEYMSNFLQVHGEQFATLQKTMVEDNHDCENALSPVFNIIISDVHVMVISLKNSEAEKEKNRSDEMQNNTWQGDRELCIRVYCKTSQKYTENYHRIPFRMDDWKLESLGQLLEAENIIENTVEYSMNPNGADFHYSLVYLKNYRGIGQITVSFDHVFEFFRNNRQVRLTKGLTEGLLDNFYGSKVLSVTGFIGKNGAGKSSIVDFLRDSFLRICSDLYSEKIISYDGFVDIKPEKMKSYRLEEDSRGEEGALCEGTRFFVIFYFNGKYYYLTNLLFEGVTLPDKVSYAARQTFSNEMTIGSNHSVIVCPYRIGDLLPMYSRNRKIVYFSQLLSPFGIADNESRMYSGDELGAVRLIEGREQGLRSERIGIFQMRDKEKGIIELSEELFNRERILPKGSKFYLNKLLVMQLLFFYSKRNVLDKYFREDFCFDNLEVVSQDLEVVRQGLEDWNLGTGIAHSFIKDLRGQDLETVLKDQEAYIRPFSSGQYSKFALLSRLYWCIKGWKEFEKIFSERGFDEKRTFGEPLNWIIIRDEIIGLHMQDTDAGVLCFDEADTYYHPDWQREFVQDILKMVNDEEREVPLQVIFTTNSPLMLSDLRREDTYLMKDYGRIPFEQSMTYNRNIPHWHNPSVPTFAQNIHTLMAKPFFLDRTIGAFADERIEFLISLMIDVSDIVEFLEKKDGRNKKYNKFIQTLSENHSNIHDKTMVILKAVKAARKAGITERKELNRCSGIAEGNYAANKLMRFRNTAKLAEETESAKYRWALMILKKHINLIGEGVLRNELSDMYNDFIARTEPHFKE